MELTLVINGLFALLSIYFGTQALFMFNKMSFGNVLNRLDELEKHKIRLLYASLFLGSTLVSLSIVQGFKYLENISVPYMDVVFFAVTLSLLSITYVWYAFLKDIKRTRN